MRKIESNKMISRCNLRWIEQKTHLFYKCLLNIKNLLQESNVSVGYHVTEGREIYEMSKM